MSIPRDVLDKDLGLTKWAIMTMYRGSIAHGMYVPSNDPNSVDDKDVMSICVPPIDYYFGLVNYGSHGTKEIKHNEWDVVIYEAKKYIGLLEQGNPNVLATLWLEEKHYINIEPAGQLIRMHRNVFNGRHVYRSFVGYAKGQMHRMIHHGDFLGHMGKKRKDLVEKYGYDCKNAAHLIRLLRMGVEFLSEGVLYVQRTHDASELLEIKQGEWSLEQVQREADKWFGLIEVAYVNSKLPNNPDIKAINSLCVDVIKTTLDWRNNWSKYND